MYQLNQQEINNNRSGLQNITTNGILPKLLMPESTRRAETDQLGPATVATVEGASPTIDTRNATQRSQSSIPLATREQLPTETIGRPP